MRDPIICDALDMAEGQPTTASKIAVFLLLMPSAGASWWERVPPGVSTLDWLARAVEREANIGRAKAMPDAMAEAALRNLDDERRAEKAEGGRNLDDDRDAEAALARSGELVVDGAFETGLRDILHNLWCDSRRCPGPPGSRDYDVVLAYAERRLVALMQAKAGRAP